MIDQSFRHMAFAHMPRPADDHRHARAAFIDAVFAAAIRSRRPMLPRKLDRLILITVEQDRAIVAAEDHQRIVRDAERAELGHRSAADWKSTRLNSSH